MPKTFTITLTDREFGALQIAVDVAITATAKRDFESVTSRNEMYKHLQRKLIIAAIGEPWCNWCDRPRTDCACHLDPNGIPAGHWSKETSA